MVDSAQAKQPAEDPAAADASAPAADDPLKNRFRAALERKRRTDAAQSGRGHGVTNDKLHEAPRAGGKRTFRRKSG